MGGRDRGGRMSDLGPDKTDTDWRARPVNEDDAPPKKEDAFGERETCPSVSSNIACYVLSGATYL